MATDESSVLTGGERGVRGEVFYRRGLAFCAAVAVALTFRAELLTDWDSWDYASQAIQRHCSDLLLGRWWFVATMRAAWLAGQAVFGLDRLDAHLAMQAGNILIFALAVVVGMAWTQRLTRSTAAEIFFALIVVLGPMFGIYSSAVMTEPLAMLMLGLAMLGWEVARTASRRAPLWALSAGLAFGVAVDIREPACMFGFWFVVSCLVDRPQRRWTLLACGVGGMVLTLGVGVLGGWAWFPWTDRTYFQNIGYWTAKMADERQRYPVGKLENWWWLIQFAVAASPLATVLALPAAVWAALRRRRLMWLLVGGLPYVVTLIINHDLSVNPRFILPLMYLLAPVAAVALADVLVERRSISRPWSAAALVTGAGVVLGVLLSPTAGITVFWTLVSMGVGGVIVLLGRPQAPGRLLGTLALVLGLSMICLTVGWDSVWRYYLSRADRQAQMYHAILNIPPDSVVIPGPGTPVAYYLNRIGQTRLTVIQSGWDWPGEQLGPLVQGHLAAGRPVYANINGQDWLETSRKHPEWDHLRAVMAQCGLCPADWPLVQLIPDSAPPAQIQTAPAR